MINMKNKRKKISELVEIKNLKSELREIKEILSSIPKLDYLTQNSKKLYENYSKRELQIMNELKELGVEKYD